MKNFKETIYYQTDPLVSQSDIERYLDNIIMLFKTVPYATAKFFYGVATGLFQVEDEDEYCFNSNPPGAESDFNTRVKKQQFLPNKVRQLLLNMSRYYFDDLLSANSLNSIIAHESFLAAFKVFIDHSPAEELFDEMLVDELHVQWNFL